MAKVLQILLVFCIILNCLFLGDIIFANGEEEIFAKEAEVSFEFNVVAESDTSVCGKWSDGDTEMIPHRKILFIKGDKLNNIIQQVKVFVT